MTVGKFHSWRERYGRVNEHNGWVPRDFWLEVRDKQAIVAFTSSSLNPSAEPASYPQIPRGRRFSGCLSSWEVLSAVSRAVRQ